MAWNRAWRRRPSGSSSLVNGMIFVTTVSSGCLELGSCVRRVWALSGGLPVVVAGGGFAVGVLTSPFGSDLAQCERCF
jgi:hypothetical protein